MRIHFRNIETNYCFTASNVERITPFHDGWFIVYADGGAEEYPSSQFEFIGASK